MNTRRTYILLLAMAGFLLQGCIAFPPLIQVEHKDNPANQELMHRLDAIEHRLDSLEQKNEKK
jgi:starvation-inducible outer membrane lipoprotein